MKKLVIVASMLLVVLTGCRGWERYKRITLSPNSIGYNGPNYSGEIKKMETNVPNRTHIQATVNPTTGTIAPMISADMQNTAQGGKVVNLYIDEVVTKSY